MPSIFGSGFFGEGTFGLEIDEISTLSIAASASNQLDLSWTNPSYPGFTGILILRRINAAVTDDPVNGTSYTTTSEIGSSRVVFVGTTSSISFVDTEAVYSDYTYHYKVFTFNSLYNYSLNGVAGSSSPIDSETPIPLSSFWIVNQTVGSLKLLWSYPTVPDIRGIHIVRRTDTYATSAGDIGLDGVIINVNYPDPYYIDTNLLTNVTYYYTAFMHDEIPNYATGMQAAAQTQRVRDYKFIKDNVLNFQARVDKERTVLYWDAPDRILTMKSLTRNNNTLSLTNTVNVGSPVYPYTSFTATASGMSITADKYKDEKIVFLDGRNIISYPKIITSYGTPSVNTIRIDPIEFQINSSELFGLDYLEDLIDSEDLYIDSTLSYTTSAGIDLYFNVNSYNKDSRSFTLNATSKYTYNEAASAAVAFDLASGESFDLYIGYYPKLYISKDKGKTYDSGTAIVYSVSNIPTTTNSFTITQTSLLNVSDSNFYVGAYLTFLSGNNKGFSRKILSLIGTTITTEYFNYTIQQNDIFTINTYSLPLVNNITDYVFKMLLWNNEENNPIYSKESVAYPALSLKNYQDALDNNYWDINLNTNLYKITQGVTKEGHSRAEDEVKVQRADFSIDNVRETKLEQNFGDYYTLEDNPNIDRSIYRKRILDIIKAFRNTGTYEGLYQVARAFTKVTPITKFISTSGWRLGAKRLGYSKTTTFTTVSSGDSTYPYTTFTVASSGLSGDYTGSYLTFTECPSGEIFDQAIAGRLFTVTAYTSGSPNSIVSINDVGFTIPIGTTVALMKPSSTSFGTVPYSDLAYLFGVRIYVYGPFMDAKDTAMFENLIRKIMPLHVNYVIAYRTNFYGETAFAGFDGTKVGLLEDKQYKTLVVDYDNLVGPNHYTENITTTITATGSSTTFSGGNTLTSKYNYYKDKYVTFTSGLNNNISRLVTSYNGGSKQFITEAFPYTIQVGDSFIAEQISYQTKYTTLPINLSTADFYTSSYTPSWFSRNITDSNLEEKVYIEFSNDLTTYNTKREIAQNEVINNFTSSSVSSGGSTTTFTGISSGANVLSFANDYYVGDSVKFINGANNGEIRTVLDYIGSTHMFTTAAFPFTISSGDAFIILKSDIAQHAKITIYHNYIESKKDIEIESLVIKV